MPLFSLQQQMRARPGPAVVINYAILMLSVCLQLAGDRLSVGSHDTAFIINPSKAHRMKDVSVRFLNRVLLAIDVAWCSLLSGGGVDPVCQIEYI